MPARPKELTPDRSARHLFGAKMRAHRERMGMSLEGLSEVVNFSRSHLSRIETAEVMAPPGLAPVLDTAFGTDGIFVELYRLASKEVHPDQYRRWMELESRARRIEEYSAHYVPGILQTEGYARAVLRSGSPAAPESAIDELVQARLNRQAVRAVVWLGVVLDEAVIRRPIGGPEVMREQLEALLPLVDSGTSTVQMIPFAVGEHPLLGGTLILATLDDRSAVAYEESIDSGRLFEDSGSVENRRRRYDRVKAYALSPTETATAIRAAMEELAA